MPQKKKINWKTISILAMAVVLLFSLFRTYLLADEVQNLETRIANLSAQLTRMENDMGEIYNEVDRRLEQQGSLLSDTEFTFGAIDTATHEIPVECRVVPKQISDDMKLALSVGGETIDFVRSGNEFAATFEVNLFGSYENDPALYIDVNGLTKTEYLRSVNLNGLYYDYLPTLFTDISYESSFSDGRYDMEGNFHMLVSAPSSESDVVFSSYTLLTERNGTQIDRRELSVPADVQDHHIPLTVNCEAEMGDEISFRIYATDSLGYVHERTLYSTVIEKIGDMGTVAVDDIERIYDQNGTLLN